MRGLSSDVALSELAPDLRVRRRLLPSAWLSRWLSGDRGLGRHDQAMTRRLAAYQFRVAVALLEDWGRLIPDPPARWRQWTPKLAPLPLRCQLGGLELPPMELGASIRPLPATAGLVGQLPLQLVREALIWAPPIVAETRGGFRVVANLVPALIARQFEPQAEIQVRVIVGRSPGQRTLLEIVAALAGGLAPIFDRYRDQIALDAPSLAESVALTGYSRAWCARLRARSGE